MKIKVPNGLLVILILTGPLLLAIFFIPLTIVRILLGLPFLLFFPGYVLIAAIYVKTVKMGRIELLTLSIGMSIAVLALIGFSLNYTTWGIRLTPVMFSLETFIAITSVIALIRRARLPTGLNLFTEFHLQLPGWKGSKINKSLSVLVILSILLMLGVLGYVLAAPKVDETFTEFYILGFNNKAETYPNEFTMNGREVINVSYYGISDTTSAWGNITLGIVNQEQQETTYSIIIQIDGEKVDINYGASIIGQLPQMKLQNGQKWQQTIGFAPKHIGDNQKVEILLFKGENAIATDSLHFWINVRETN